MWLRVALLALWLCVLASDARAAWNLGAGVEHFAWTEDTDPITVEERGPRFGFSAGFAQPLGAGFQAALQGRYYLGSVRYDGSFLVSPNVPVSGTTDYAGAMLLGQLRLALGQGFEATAGIELDQWRRALGTNQNEDYRIVSLRFGAEHVASLREPWHVGAGLRTTIATDEDAHFTDIGFDQNPGLEPGASTAPYFALGYRLVRNWVVIGSFEAYDFGRSNQVQLTRGSTRYTSFQPASTLQLFGLRLEYRRAAE